MFNRSTTIPLCPIFGGQTNSILPLAKRYASELEAIRDRASREARPNDAGAIDIELVKARVRIIELSSSAPLLTKQKKGNAPLHEDKVCIFPNRAEGFPVGPVKAGDQIELQYVGGMWKGWGILATINPDDPRPQERGDAARLVIAANPKDGMPGKVIKIVPSGTAQKPFVFEFTNDEPQGVCLRICENSDNHSSPGEVVYKVTITSPESRLARDLANTTWAYSFKPNDPHPALTVTIHDDRTVSWSDRPSLRVAFQPLDERSLQVRDRYWKFSPDLQSFTIHPDKNEPAHRWGTRIENP